MDWTKEPEKPKAPFPHRVTIVLGLLSPFLGVVALLLSYNSLNTSRISLETSKKSLETSQRAVEIGQRAYLTGEMQVNSVVFVTDEKGNVSVNLGIDLVVSNLGNTPATDVEIKNLGTLEFDTAFETSWKGEGKKVGPRQAKPVHLVLTRILKRNLQDTGGIGEICVSIKYKDAFDFVQKSDDICTK